MTASTGFKVRKNVMRWLVPGTILVLTGCSAEMGRTWNDTDVSCLRKQMGTEVHLSFPLAANTCQRMTNHNFFIGADKAKPLPLNLKGAPDLQSMAETYGYSYTR